MPLYELSNIVHSYNGHRAIEIDHLQMAGNRIIGLLGPNGSGKSTLLKLLGFVERPSSGRIQLNGRLTEPFDPAVREMVTLLPQETFLLKRSVYLNIAYGLRLRNQRQAISQRVREAMSLVGLDFDGFAQRLWFALSGGEAHRVALAARLALRPKVLLMDEPTASVDAASAQHIKAAAVHAHRQWGSSVIIASHDIQWLRDICHETHYLFQGKLSGHAHRSLLFGPWRRLNDHLVGMAIADDQDFKAAHPIADATHKVAGIDPARMSLHTSPDTIRAELPRLHGILTSLSLDRQSGRIDASVQVGHIVFHALVDPKILPHNGLTPGQVVWLAYDSNDVAWY